MFYRDRNHKVAAQDVGQMKKGLDQWMCLGLAKCALEEDFSTVLHLAFGNGYKVLFRTHQAESYDCVHFINCKFCFIFFLPNTNRNIVFKNLKLAAWFGMA